MPSSNSSSSNSTNGSKGRGLFNALLLLTFIVLLMFYVQYRWTVSELNPADNSKLPVNTRKDFEALMSQTQQLLEDISRANLTLSKPAIQDLKNLRREENLISQETKELEEQLTRTEKGLQQCMISKYSFSQQLDDCEVAKRAALTTLPHNLPARQQQQPTASIPSSNKKWLIIGIPTIARRDHLDYLSKTLKAMEQQLSTDPSDLLYHKILICIFNLQTNTDASISHQVYQQVKAYYTAPSNPYREYFHFEELSVSAQRSSPLFVDPIPGNKNAFNDPGTANKPGYLVRRQTRNIAYVMERCLELTGISSSVDQTAAGSSAGRSASSSSNQPIGSQMSGEYYLFLEDDMLLCSSGILAIQYLLSKANKYHPNWLAIRASYGMNGIFFHLNQDLLTFQRYLVKHQARRPPDHLVVEWYAGETKESAAYKHGRKNLGFKYNLFDHLGSVSTLRSTPQTSFPRCYELLIEPTVFQVEAFNPRECPRDDLWPCRELGGGEGVRNERLIDWSKLR